MAASATTVNPFTLFLSIKRLTTGMIVCPSNVLPLNTSYDMGKPSFVTIKAISICGWLDLLSFEKPFLHSSSSSNVSK
jgi:hypothetical protein